MVLDNVAVVQIFVGTVLSPSFVQVPALVGTLALLLVVAGGKITYDFVQS